MVLRGQSRSSPFILLGPSAQRLTDSLAARESSFHPVNLGNSPRIWEKHRTQVDCKYGSLLFPFQNWESGNLTLSFSTGDLP